MKILIALLFTVNAFAGFTPFPPAAPPADSITAKGNLLTSDGSAQVEFTACADDEILVWDAAELSGMKCEAKPSGGSVPDISYVDMGYWAATTSSYVTKATLSTTVPASGILTVETVPTPGQGTGNGQYQMNGSAGAVRVLVNGVSLGDIRLSYVNNNDGHNYLRWVGTGLTPGPATVTLQALSFSGYVAGRYLRLIARPY